MNRIVRNLVLPALLAGVPAAHAATCQVTATDLAFGTYRGHSPIDVDSSAEITVQCVDDGTGDDANYTIEIGPGTGGSFMPRTMGGDAQPLEYNLFADASRQLVWGDGSGGTVTVGGSIDLPGTTSATHTAYGSIPARQAQVAPGIYTDLLTITVTY